MSVSAYECAALLLDTLPGLMRAIASAMRQRCGDDDDIPTMVQLRMLAMLAARPWSLGGGTIKGCGNTLRAVYPSSWHKT